MFENVLVCIDGTGKSEAVIPIVSELAERFHSKLFLLNVTVRPTYFYHAGKAEIGPEKLTEFSEHEEQMAGYLEKIAEPLLQSGLNVECIIIEGSVEESIIACAKKYKADLIVLVRRDRGTLSRFIIGSISDFVLRKSVAPVLSINSNMSDI